MNNDSEFVRRSDDNDIISPNKRRDNDIIPPKPKNTTSGRQLLTD